MSKINAHERRSQLERSEYWETTSERVVRILCFDEIGGSIYVHYVYQDCPQVGQRLVQLTEGWKAVGRNDL